MNKDVVLLGAGLIGSHIAEYLLKLEHLITVIDNFKTGF